MHVNKVSRVGTIDRVAKDLGEDVDFLFDVAIEMEAEDGLIWVLSLGDESVMAFTDDGVDSLVELIKIHRETKPRGVLISAPSASPCGLCRTVTVHRALRGFSLPSPISRRWIAPARMPLAHRNG
jgi:hypothetical protein